MRILRTLVALAFVLAVLAATATAGSRSGGFKATTLTPSDTIRSAGKATRTAKAAFKTRTRLVSVIVKVKVAPLVSYRGSVRGFAATNPRVTGRKLSLRAAASRRYLRYVNRKLGAFERAARRVAPRTRITHTYNLVYGGVSMLVPPSKLRQLARLRNVVSIQRDTLEHVQTDVTPQFIGAPTVWQKLGGQGSAGEGIIVGVLDTGIWPEHPSFSDPDPLGKPYAAPPPPLSGTRQCEFTGGSHPGAAFTCNNKLIGADRFMATYDALIGLLPGEFTTARDDNGHGSHTSSTAAGDRGVAASIFGVPRGTISGIAPRAQVMMYKVCGVQGCFSSDSAAAVQKAIQDGVNVINFSIGGGNEPYSDPVSLAFLDAYNAGVFVAASAGNSGPGADTVSHREPWTTSVAASTANRAFQNTATITAGATSLTLTGTSLTAGVGPAPLVSAADAPYNDPFCANGTADGAFTGKIVVCERGAGIGRVQKGFNVLQRGAVAWRASSVPRGHRGGFELGLLLRYGARPAEEEERERDPDPGEDGDGEEGRLEAFGQRDEPVGAGVRGQVVLGAGDGDGSDDRDPERRADLEAGVAEPGGEPGLAFGHPGEGGDRGGDEGEADAGAEDEQAEEDVTEVAAADRDLGEQQRPAAHQRHADRGHRAEADPQHERLPEHGAEGGHDREDERGEPELDGGVAEHLLRVEREDEPKPVGERAEDEHDRVGAHDRSRAEDAQRHQRCALARLDRHEGRQQHARAGEQADRLRVAPALVGRLHDGVDEQRERAGGVVTPLRERGPALPQEEGRERERGHADGDVDEEDPRPAEAVDDRTSDQPGGGRADAAERAPDPKRLVALGPLLE